MRPLKEKVSVTLDSDVIEKIREFAELDARPFSQYINLVLKKHIENKVPNEIEDMN
ncbi:MAG: toxin-antitoxin system protein [Oscillospiraceae bacterium]